MAEFINTIDALGDDTVIDGIIQRNITEFNDDKVTKIGNAAFKYCANLEGAKIPKATSLSGHAFNGCASLKELNLESISAWNAMGDGVFEDCTSLKKVNLPNESCLFYVALFNRCTSLTTVDTAKLAELVSNSAFANCTALKTFIMRRTGICSLSNTNAFGNTPISKGTGYIYVPKAFLSDDDETKDYRRATNWAVFATQFRALEDYTVDGTITGEPDETKI